MAKPRPQVVIGPRGALTLAAIAVVAVAVVVLVELDRGEDQEVVEAPVPAEKPLPDRPRTARPDRPRPSLPARPLAPVRPDPRPAPRPTRPGRPDPGEVYAVGVDGAPVRGPDTALVTIIKIVDYACPYCQRNRTVIDQIERTYGDDVRIVIRNMVVHASTATVSARAACAAHRQGKFWAMDALLWEQAFATRQFDQDHIAGLADQAGLDMRRFRDDLASGCPDEIDRDMADLRRFGVSATPSFFINGRYLSGARPFADFAEVIDEELAKARRRVAGGTRRADYYREWVMGHGRPHV